MCFSLRQLPHSSITWAFLSMHWPHMRETLSTPGNWQFPLQSMNADLSVLWSLQIPHSSLSYACCCGRESSGGIHRPRQSLLIEPLTSFMSIWSKHYVNTISKWRKSQPLIHISIADNYWFSLMNVWNSLLPAVMQIPVHSSTNAFPPQIPWQSITESPKQSFAIIETKYKL